jgi:hypothetical protein
MDTESTSSKLRLAFYSSIPCAPTFGGPLQIHRHFRERDDFEFIDLNPKDAEPWDGWLPKWVVTNRVFKRLCRTRLYPWIIYSSYHTLLGKQAREVARKIKENKADALVTVAYGRRCHVCRTAARLAKVPLITFYHDWWPDLVFGKTPRTLAWLDREFRRLAMESDLILPVSQALFDELGGHPNAVVLPPIPANLPQTTTTGATADARTKHRLVYAGTLQGPYGTMVRQLAFALLESFETDWELKAYGLANDWPRHEMLKLTEAGVYGGLLEQGDQLNNALSNADALLVVMNFEPEDERRVRTSFPSKLLDYVPFTKPIFVWGPANCAACQWAAHYNLGNQITNPNTSAVVGSLSSNIPDDTNQADFDHHWRVITETFGPDNIHARLAHAVHKLI